MSTYAEAILAKLLRDAEDEGYYDLDHHGMFRLEGAADLTEEEAGWLEEFRNRALPAVQP